MIDGTISLPSLICFNMFQNKYTEEGGGGGGGGAVCN